MLSRIWLIYLLVALTESAHYWTWKCTDHNCIKYRLQPDENPISQKVCELQCNTFSRIWPMPHGKFVQRNITPIINLDSEYTQSGAQSAFLQMIVNRFLAIVAIYNDNQTNSMHVEKTKIHFNIGDFTTTKLDLDTDESYVLDVFQNEKSTIRITIMAATLFGARHALETLSQVILYDEINKNYVVPPLHIEDSPVYPVRGLLLDTSRNFISVNTIKRTIEGMAVNKLNTFHWHITDTQSFPYESKFLPQLAELGAYSSNEVYSRKDVQDIMDWASIRGVRILPEFDGPAHVGEGWQDTDLLVCFNKQPWRHFCKEPPCGQFDPTKDELYATLTLLFRDMIDAFDPDLFHFGGDEVDFNCWQSEKSIIQWMKDHGFSDAKLDFVKLWNYYQNRTHSVFMKERRYDIPAIVWTSTLTEEKHLHYLPHDKYIIHVWTDRDDKTIKHLLEHDYRMIFSNYDKLYLDCGFHSWVSSGDNWCSPYIGWKEIYENSPAKIVENFGKATNKPNLIMGAETALWTETVDDASADTRIWPRTAALAERVWAEPKTTWSEAEYRLNAQHDRLIKLGIRAETLVPQWCQLNQGSCHDRINEANSAGLPTSIISGYVLSLIALFTYN